MNLDVAEVNRQLSGQLGKHTQINDLGETLAPSTHYLGATVPVGCALRTMLVMHWLDHDGARGVS
jgi:hypothetical protein